MHQWQSKSVGDAFQYILDTFSGANSDFAAFMFLIREFDERAAKGDEAAAKVLQEVIKFSRLIKVARVKDK